MVIQAKTIQLDNFRQLLSPRARDAHKGMFGHVLIVGGNHGMVGAVRLAGEAALRVGAGLVSVGTQAQSITAIVSERPEIMAHAVKTANDLKPLLKKASVIVLGPGLGQTSWSRQLFKQVLNATLLKVLDADALNLLAKHTRKSENWILTPHPGEAARLLDCTVETIQANRIDAVQALQKHYGGVVVLKGAGSLVCSNRCLRICSAGNPGMASGGMGDVLSGVIGGLLAQHFNLQQAAEYGVYLHALAADKAANLRGGERGLLASDLMPYLQRLANRVYLK